MKILNEFPLIVLLTAILAVISLAGCANQPGPSPTESPIGTPLATTGSPLATPEEVDEISTRIMFKSEQDGELRWQTMKADGTDVQPLDLQVDGEIKILTWIPELRSFATIINLDGQFDLYLLDQRGGVKERLTSTADTEGWPAYSSAAEAFAFPCVRSDLDICTVSIGGGEITNLTGYPSREDSPVWSPTGDRILFVSNRDAVPDIWVVNRDGSELKNLTQTGQPDGSPSWSPDGDKILFTSQRDQNWEVYVMSSDGQNPVNLTDDPAVDVTPQWSPDANYVAFRSDRTGNEDIFAMKADGTDLTNLTNSPDSEEYAFRWSLDGESILYVSDADGDSDIFMVSRDGRTTRNLTNNSVDDIAPQWIYY